MAPDMDQIGVKFLETALNVLDQGLTAFENSELTTTTKILASDEYPEWVAQALNNN